MFIQLRHNPDAPCIEYLHTLGGKWPHSKGNVGKFSRPMEHLGQTKRTHRSGWPTQPQLNPVTGASFVQILHRHHHHHHQQQQQQQSLKRGH